MEGLSGRGGDMSVLNKSNQGSGRSQLGQFIRLRNGKTYKMGSYVMNTSNRGDISMC